MNHSPTESSPTGSSPTGSSPTGSSPPGTDPAPDPLGSAAAPTSPHWTDPVEAQGARFAQEADEDDGTRRAVVGDPVGDDLTPDFLPPTPAEPT